MIRLIPGCGFVSRSRSLLRPPPLRGAANRSQGSSAPVRPSFFRRDGDRALDLSRADVRAIFKCRGCTFAGAVAAPDATFERTVDLSGSQFRQSVDLSGATFRAPALFRVALVEKGERRDEPTTFSRDADFSLATFEDLVSFARHRVRASGTFRDTRFADVTFASATFAQTGDFERASFRGVGELQPCDVRGEATVHRGRLQAGRPLRADEVPRRRHLHARAVRGGHDLPQRALRPREGRRGGRAVPGRDGGRRPRLHLRRVRGRRGRDVAGAAKRHRDLLGPRLGRSIVFRNTTFAEGHRLTMLGSRRGSRPRRRRRAEDRRPRRPTGSSRRSRRARRAVATSELRTTPTMRSWPRRARTTGRLARLGPRLLPRDRRVFVRPFRPLLVLLALAIVLSLVRFARRASTTAVADDTSRLRRSEVARAPGQLSPGRLPRHALERQVGAHRQRGRGAERRRAGRGVRVPAAPRLRALGLANSNPTLREMFDTLV